MPDESVRPCNGCGMNTLCRSYGRGSETLHLCVRRCYRKRKSIKALKSYTAKKGDPK